MINNLTQIIPDLTAGLSDKDIAKKYKVSRVYISKIVRRLKDAGYDIPKRKAGRKSKPF